MQLLISLYLFIIGASFGSFAGAMAWRIEKGKDVVKDRSECEHCHHKLTALDLIPIVSWLALRGKCRYCRYPIGTYALALEVSLGLAFVASYIWWPLGLSSNFGIIAFLLWLLALVMLAILFIYDVRHYLLPDRVVWPLTAVGAGIFICRAYMGEWTMAQTGVELLLGMIPVAGVYGILYAISGGKWIGFGDVKLGLFIGLVLGWQGAFLALLLANVLGCVWIIPAMLMGRIGRETRIAFGPFLIVATFVAFLWGERIIDAYTSLLLG